MNKTININLGGYFFHIDESAYQKLRRYLDAIAKSLSDDPQGKNEIISDIETRISELLSEKIADARQVVNEQDISDVIKIMGEPEDYSEADEAFTSSDYSYSRKKTNGKKLFRDGDNKFIAGVAAGLSHYFNIDVVWIRLIFILTTIFSGFGLLAYIIFWVATPEAGTTAEKLQMEGEAVNIDNIEKKIREEFENVSETIKDGASQVGKKVNETFKKNSKKTQTGFQDFLDTIGKIIITLFKVIGKFIGFILVLVSSIAILSFIIALFSIGSFEMLGIEGLQLPPFFYNSVLPHWLLAVCGVILAGFPFLLLFILGLRILSDNVKQFSKTTSLTLIGIWIIALMILAFSGIEITSSNARSGNYIEIKDLSIQPNDTLQIKMVNDNSIDYQSTFRRRNNRKEVYVSDNKMWYSNYVKLDVRKSEDSEATIEIRKRSAGRNSKKAKESARELIYEYKIDGNILALNSYFLSDYGNIAKDELISITIYLPEGNTVFFDESTKTFINNIDNTDDIYDDEMIEHHFLITEDGLDCSDCKEEIIEESI